MSDLLLAVLADGPFRGGTYVVSPGRSLEFADSWFNSRVVYEPTGEVVDTDEGEAVVMRSAPAVQPRVLQPHLPAPGPDDDLFSWLPGAVA